MTTAYSLPGIAAAGWSYGVLRLPPGPGSGVPEGSTGWIEDECHGAVTFNIRFFSRHRWEQRGTGRRLLISSGYKGNINSMSGSWRVRRNAVGRQSPNYHCVSGMSP